VCGIFGGLALTRPLRDETVRALRSLAHRGPDGEGIADFGHAVFGHRRLSIIDLSHAADQPMRDVHEQVAIVFNGEIYNYRELRAECAAAGLPFASQSDTEVILGQYLLHGERAFDRLNGMFAFCLFDARSGDAYLVRDRFGIKPLYYAPAARGVLFSSELQPLLEVDGVDGTLDRAALQAYLQLDFVPSPYSIVRGVRKLDSGSFLRVTRDGVTTAQNFTQRKQPAARFDEGEALDELSRRIDAAVERHLIADVPVGVFLSGGIDSTIIAATAERLTGGRIATFSIGFDDPSFDESRWFAAVARELGVAPNVRTLTPEMLLALVPHVAATTGEPLADGSIFPTMLLSSFAREQVTVALSGDGADELFAGYPTYLAHRVTRVLPPPLVGLLHALRRPARKVLPVRFENLTREYQALKFLDGLTTDAIARHVRWMGTFTEEELPRLLVEYDADAQRELSRLLVAPSREVDANWLEPLLRNDQRFYLQDGVLVKTDRASMAASLEVRVPFLDRELVDFADSLPARAKLDGTRSKALLRTYVAQRFPASIARRPKKGFGAPLGKWFRAELRPLLEQLLAPSRLEQGGVFRPEFVRNLLNEHWCGARDNRKQIFNILAFTMWQERF
jgi:asparagine synthase (glutamine-hydrolysing)